MGEHLRAFVDDSALYFDSFLQYYNADIRTPLPRFWYMKTPSVCIVQTISERLQFFRIYIQYIKKSYKHSLRTKSSNDKS